jgi:hypothetical protein
MQKKNRDGRATTKMSLEQEIAHLRGLDLKGLRSRWQSVFQRPAPAHLTRHLLFAVTGPVAWNDSVGQLLATLFADHVFGVPVRPVRIVFVGPPFVPAMRDGRAPECGSKIGLGRKCRLVCAHTSRQASGDLLEEPGVAIRIAESGQRAVARQGGIWAADARRDGKSFLGMSFLRSSFGAGALVQI